MASDNHDNLYIADGANERIIKLNSNGEQIAQWGSRVFASLLLLSTPYGLNIKPF